MHLSRQANAHFLAPSLSGGSTKPPPPPVSTSMDSCGNMLALPLCLQVGGWEGHVGGHADVMEPWLSKVWLKALLEQIFLFLAAF